MKRTKHNIISVSPSVGRPEASSQKMSLNRRGVGVVAVLGMLGGGAAVHFGEPPVRNYINQQTIEHKIDHQLKSPDALRLVEEGKIDSSKVVIIRADQYYGSASEFATHLDAAHLLTSSTEAVQDEIDAQLRRGSDNHQTSIGEGQEFAIYKGYYQAPPTQEAQNR